MGVKNLEDLLRARRINYWKVVGRIVLCDEARGFLMHSRFLSPLMKAASLWVRQSTENPSFSGKTVSSVENLDLIEGMNRASGLIFAAKILAQSVEAKTTCEPFVSIQPRKLANVEPVLVVVSTIK